MSWREWEALIIGGLFVIIRVVMFIVREMRSIRELRIARSQQLVQLVKLAHGVSEVGTMFDIRVSERMRDALCAPLTREQLTVIRSAETGVFCTYVKCSLISSCFKGEELSGVVQISVRVSSKFSEKPMVCPNVKLKITVSGKGRPGIGHRWEVTSVEQIA